MNPAASISLSNSWRVFENSRSLISFRVVLLSVFVLAFATRLLVRLYFGEEYFWRNSYSLFYELAQRLAEGHGLSYEWSGMKYAFRPPVYPALLAATTIFGKSFIAIVILQSLIGAGTAVCAYFIGKELFDKTVGLLAALGVTLYPYFVMHDTALQETGVFTFLTALTVLLLLKSRRSKTIALAAGLALGLAILTRATLIAFVPVVLLWMIFISDTTRAASIKKTALVGLGLFVVLTPWLARNYARTGSVTISTLGGLTLWAGNNAHTFANYPHESIDRSVVTASRELSPEDVATIRRLSTDEAAQNSWFFRKGIDYIKQHPGETTLRAVKKVGAAFSWTLNPMRERFVQTVYFLSYVPVSVLAIIGGWLGRKRWKDLSLIYGLFLSFILLTAVFFGHTSHRVYLDVYMIVLAAFSVSVILKTITGGRRVNDPEPLSTLHV